MCSEEVNTRSLAEKTDELKMGNERRIYLTRRDAFFRFLRTYTRTRAPGKFTDESRREPFPLREINAS